jgi:hypothetical protein
VPRDDRCSSAAVVCGQPGGTPASSIASEILALSKLNWNRARLDARKPITLLTARRVGEVLRHVPDNVTPAARYAYYM